MKAVIKQFPRSPIQYLSNERKKAILDQTKFTRPNNNDIWIFGFGSLMWNPCFRYVENSLALLLGYERNFHIWTTVARGTPERPGLGLCLEKARGKTLGVAFRICEESLDEALSALWDREMTTGIYQPEWLLIQIGGGKQVRALTFVVDAQHPQYIGNLSLKEMSWIIAGASGQYGHCRDYLANMLGEMTKLGDVSFELISLLSRVDSLTE